MAGVKGSLLRVRESRDQPGLGFEFVSVGISPGVFRSLFLSKKNRPPFERIFGVFVRV